MSPVEHNAINRSIEGLSFGQVIASEEKRAGEAYEQLGEFDQQYQVPISGAATDAITWRELTIAFDWPFLDATGERDSDFTTPQFTHGSVITAGQPVVVTSVVRAWKFNHQDSVIGALIAVGVFLPGGTETPFIGEVHLTFQGFGAPSAATDPDGNDGDI